MEAFLEGRIPWLGIAQTVDEVLQAGTGNVDDVSDVLEADRVASGPAPGVHRPTSSRVEVPVKDPLDDGGVVVETRKAVTGIAVILIGLAVLVVTRPSSRVTISIIVGLVLTIMLHEAGHLIMAKRAGMKATEFFVGFGRRLWSFRKGETEYGVKAIPGAATSGSSA